MTTKAKAKDKRTRVVPKDEAPQEKPYVEVKSPTGNIIRKYK